MYGLGVKIRRLGLVVVDREKNNFCSTTTTAQLVLPSELFSVEEVMKELHAAVAGLKTPGLDKTEVMRLRGTIADWHKLSGFHYRGHLVAGPRRIFRLVRGDELCGVIVYCYPPPSCFGRRLVLPHMSMQELNEKLSIINRVVIHPKYRTIGLGARIIRETLALAGTPYVEMVAVMAKYNPFAEKAGLRKVVEQKPLESVLRVAELLSQFGFDLPLLSSDRYVLEKLKRLSHAEVGKLKELFVKNKHPRFRKEFAVSRHQPFGKTSDYVQCIKNADSGKMAKLAKIVGMLLQTKVYLFWSNA